MMSKYKFYSDCVGWPRDKVDQLHEMIDSGKTITRSTFLKHVDRDELKEIEKNLGYVQHPKQGHGLTMANDWHVSYERGVLEGRRCYFFTHSGIEIVFTR